jgi:hypothetical protein
VGGRAAARLGGTGAKLTYYQWEAHMASRVATALGFGLAVVGLVALPHTVGAERGIRVGQAAPEITGGPWVNSAPLSLGALRGRVVFVEFWTYG